PQLFTTCALVTSSGQLTGSKRGEEIDHSECVIRMNDAPNIGYQRDVGWRTSLRVIAHSSLQRVLRSRQELLNVSQDTVFIFWGPSSCMRRDGKGHVYNNLRLLNQLLPKLKVYIISRIKMLKFDELFKKETGIDRYMDSKSVHVKRNANTRKGTTHKHTYKIVISFSHVKVKFAVRDKNATHYTTF
uniref:ST6 N-acetylgalactosaminide alpha-2,6-sialyltransferase 5 n=1 Tax=Lates calcarifer TaxID=8187 RepID=A0A4W6DI44_LATCA